MRLSLEALEDRIVPAAYEYTVNVLTDTGAGKGFIGDLRYCINQANANPGSTIAIQVVGAIQLNSALPPIRTSVYILGNGKAAVQGSGNPANLFSDFTVTATGSVAINELTIQGGYAAASGAINNSGTASLGDVTIKNNTATGKGGGIYNGLYGSLTLTDDTIQSNTAAGGGGVFNSGFVQACNGSGTVFKSNTATGNGGGLYNLGTADLGGTDTFADNNANLKSGMGGGIYNGSVGALTLGDATLASNSAYQGGGLYNAGTATLQGVDVKYNTAFQGGGIFLGANSTTTFNKAETVQNNQLLPGGKATGVGFLAGATMINPAQLHDLDDPNGNPVQC